MVSIARAANGQVLQVLLSNHGALEDRLEDDFREIQGRIGHHLAVMVYFYANFFRAIRDDIDRRCGIWHLPLLHCEQRLGECKQLCNYDLCNVECNRRLFPLSH